VLPVFLAAAEGATRSETLRQTDCESGLTLESGRYVGPPKGCGAALGVAPDLSGNRTEGRQTNAELVCRFFVSE
jgi:hypothetical protein